MPNSEAEGKLEAAAAAAAAGVEDIIVFADSTSSLLEGDELLL